MTGDRAAPAPDTADPVGAALAEDIGPGDITTRATVSRGLHGRATIVARASGIVAGLEVAAETYRRVDPLVEFAPASGDGSFVEPEAVVAVARGPFAALLTAERVALNFLQHLSGIATLTARFVAAVEGTRARIVDTRKTTPGLRALEKGAVRAGGGWNHRIGLYDAYLIKENHIAGAGGIAAALAAVAVHNREGKPAEIEVRSIEELALALAAEPHPDRILCDNFSLDDLATAVERIRSRAPRVLIEASGGVNLSNVRAVAEMGVDWISVGALTHSAPALDLSCRIERS
ncbi:MAG TPA: carboxylating nicotinate-nucleotide diphosphorylase [Gemmatimonadota bacterium]|nr:carboxylating nicotinate-nucleotide diphosphorylase [Gemmatimonadota bacterium]